jgi:Family of unknown function (DUF5763)
MSYDANLGEIRRRSASYVDRILINLKTAKALGPMSRCRGTTKAGRPCSNGAGPTGYCIAHAKDPQTLATLQAARSAGGRAPRVNVQVGLPAAVAEAIDLKDSTGQLAILSATTRALAMGRVSSNTAQAIAALIKVAAAINAADQAEAIKALEARLESLVVDVAPRAGGR